MSRIFANPKETEKITWKSLSQQGAKPNEWRVIHPYNSNPQIQWVSDIRVQSINPFKNDLVKLNRESN